MFEMSRALASKIGRSRLQFQAGGDTDPESIHVVSSINGSDALQGNRTGDED
jgi:hypothetical protein